MTEELTALWQRVVKHYGLRHGCQKVETSIPLYSEDGSLEGYRGADMYAIAADGDLPYLIDDVGEPLADFITAAIALTGWRVHPPRYAYPAGRPGNAADRPPPAIPSTSVTAIQCRCTSFWLLDEHDRVHDAHGTVHSAEMCTATGVEWDKAGRPVPIPGVRRASDEPTAGPPDSSSVSAAAASAEKQEGAATARAGQDARVATPLRSGLESDLPAADPTASPDVYERPECPFNYCDAPETCKPLGYCRHRSPEERQ